MLADLMIRLVMETDGVSETQLRHVYSASRTPLTDSDVLDLTHVSQSPRDNWSIQAAENEGMLTQTD
jgi:hypothetical protein